MKKNIASNNWALVTLGQCGELYCGQSSPVAEVNTQGRGHPYFTGPEQWDGVKLHVNKWTQHPRRLVPDGCIFITVKGAGVGKMFPGMAGAIGRDIYAYRVHDAIEFKYVYYALKFTVEQIVAQAKGDIPGLSKSHIVDHKIILPSIHQQRRVVERIDELMSALEKGIESLTTGLQQSEILRLAIMNNAFSGTLVASEHDDEPVAELLRRIDHAKKGQIPNLAGKRRQKATR
jgi:type I restriction enzyme, S subunit